MKKVLIINSSFRKKNTYKVLKSIEDIFKGKDIEVEYLHLHEYDIKDCYGCEVCILKGMCSINDDMIKIIEKIENCDGIIISTPVYMNNLSGKLKTFFDRTCEWFHRPRIPGKPVLLVATTASSGLSSTFKVMNSIMLQWGTNVTGTIGRKISRINQKVDYKEVEKFIHTLKGEIGDYRPSLNQLITFQVQKILAENVFPLDKEYWENQGWINNIYFYSSKINFFKKIISRLFYKILKRNVKPCV
ncbi:NADPH-dependent FMN reductase RutF [Gottschalkia purinilytica]|uniref:NADPH-dependent FMN reductase RutF n=1 Tax=Gottschalkia purinilytica TaxID=1503 RepID=A0A0L0WF34_GOTPU|nr:flavodoxin family protein [Gottschalkia purinilytica]KNF10036.1 NADPH-dependent FMN reductase RutF [Gottschalkia purinilytica]